MRFGYALLGLVALTSIHTSSGQQCSNGLAGFEKDDVCCDADCGACGGKQCGLLPGGQDNCCTSRIRDSGVMCSATQPAPCIIENDSMCDNGLPGIQSGDICCASSCGTCGGSGCAQLPGGSTSCCTGLIRSIGTMCDTTLAAPCVIGADVDAVCDNGLPGVQNGDICCDASCGTCGGRGCAKRPGGSASCCRGRIRDSTMMCDTTMAAPCIVNDSTSEPTSPPTSEPTAEPTADPTSEATEEPEAVCSNGFVGVQSNSICCEAQCGTCGGTGCGLRPGGEEGCCSTQILNNGTACSIALEAPCFIDI